MSVQATRWRERSFEAFARRVEDALGEAVHEIIHYGSTARGEATETSDVDVLVVLQQPATEEQGEVVSTLASEVGLEYDVAISYHVQSRERFEARRTTLFFKRVLRTVDSMVEYADEEIQEGAKPIGWSIRHVYT